MGYFTWTAANRTPRKLRNSDYAANCKLGYFGYAAIVCPDDTLITEERYEGYGKFDGHDVYDLVVDWNKDHLTEIPNLPGFKKWGDSTAYEAIMKAYQEDDEEALRSAIDAAALTDSYVNLPRPVKGSGLA